MLTLLATPVVYSLFDDVSQMLSRRKALHPVADRPLPSRAEAAPPLPAASGVAVADVFHHQAPAQP
jgi:hypothetical protein